MLIAIWLALSITACSQQDENDYSLQESLTRQHGDQIVSILETTLIKLGSLDVQQDPSLISEWVTGPYLDVLTPPDPEEGGEQTGLTYIMADLQFNGLRVYKYSDAQFTAMGCGFSVHDQVTANGDYVQSLTPRNFRNLYFYSRDEGLWKIALIVLLDSAYDDWKYAADWEKELVGDLDLYLYAECFDFPVNGN